MEVFTLLFFIFGTEVARIKKIGIMVELILYGFIVWHIYCFAMNVVHKDRLTFLRVVRAICISLLFGKVLGEYLYEILG